jgi:hypothetical protein
MKSFIFAAAALVPLVLVTAGCASASPPANRETVWPGQPGTNAYVPHAPDGATSAGTSSRPPRLTVGTSYSDTQLILPWFLNDVINFVNYR